MLDGIWPSCIYFSSLFGEKEWIEECSSGMPHSAVVSPPEQGGGMIY
jgi:hypothetical protein